MNFSVTPASSESSRLAARGTNFAKWLRQETRKSLDVKNNGSICMRSAFSNVIRRIRVIRAGFATSQLLLALEVQSKDASGMSDERLVISTVGSKEEASKIAAALVEEQIAACVNIVGPIESVYRWQGHVDNAQEFLLLVKTTSARSATAIKRIRELHSYELPEAIELNIEGGSADYLKWIAESVR